MAKVYIISEKDIDRLLTLIDRNPLHGYDGGSSNASVNDDRERRAHAEAHRFYNHQVRKWVGEVKAD